MDSTVVRLDNRLTPFAIAAVLLCYSGSITDAASLRFLPGTVPAEENSLTVLGDGVFEVSDTPNPAPNSHQFSVVSTFDVEVEGRDPAGEPMSVVFQLDRVSTTNDRMNLIFMNPTYDELLLFFDVPGLVKGQPIPAIPISDADGTARWNAPLLQPISPGVALAGALDGAMIVPEPTGIVAISLAGLAIFGFGRFRN